MARCGRNKAVGAVLVAIAAGVVVSVIAASCTSASESNRPAMAKTATVAPELKRATADRADTAGGPIVASIQPITPIVLKPIESGSKSSGQPLTEVQTDSRSFQRAEQGTGDESERVRHVRPTGPTDGMSVPEAPAGKVTTPPSSAPAQEPSKPATSPSPASPAAPVAQPPRDDKTKSDQAPGAPSPRVGGGGGGGETGSGESGRSPANRPASTRGPAGGATDRPRGSDTGTVREQVADPAAVGANDLKIERLEAAATSPDFIKNPGPRFDEELVVVVRAKPPEPAQIFDAAPLAVAGRRGTTPGSGALIVRSAPAVLRETSIKASLAGPISQVHVQQRFENPSDAAADAVYVLPLPRDSSITDFVLTVGDRQIRGVIRERADAEKIFLDAQQQGKLATLLHADRDSVFVQRVANLAPGATVDIGVTYFGMLEYAAGAFELRLPLAVSPQHHGVSAAGDVRRGDDVSVEVEIEAPTRLGAVTSPSHQVEVVRRSPRGATVKLARSPEIANRPFVLRYGLEPTVLGAGVEAGLLMQPDAEGCYFSLLVLPPSGALPPRPVDLVLVPTLAADAPQADRELVRRLCTLLLERLGAEDRVALPGPDGKPAFLGAVSRDVTAIMAASGSDRPLAAALAAAMQAPTAGRDRVICVIGPSSTMVGDDALRAVRTASGDARVFAFGYGGPVGLGLEDLARVGRGGVVAIDAERLETSVSAFMERECRPVMTDLAIDWGGAQVADVYPRRLPPLCAGRPVHIIGRLVSPGARPIRVEGTVRGDSGLRRDSVAVAWNGEVQTAGAIRALWARAKISELAEQLSGPGGDDARKAMLKTALSNSVVSRVSSFITVDTISTPAGGIVGPKREP